MTQPKAMTFSEAVSWHAAREPQRAAIICDDVTIDRQHLDEAANRTARAYARLGVTQGDVVAIALPNSIEFYVAVLASWRLGATPLPISSRMPLIEREAVLDLVDPKLLVGVDPAYERRQAVPAGWDGPAREPADAMTHLPADPAIALTSGGSTGRPKIIFSKRSAYVDPLAATSGMTVDGVQLVAGPTYHNGPFTFSVNGLITGSTLVVMPRFYPAQTLDLIAEHRVDWLFAVPTMFHRIWQLPPAVREAADMSSIKVVFSSGSPWPAWLKEHWVHWLGGDKIIEAYGGTEAFGATMITGTEALRKPGSVGRPIPGNQLRILDPDGHDVPTGEVGEVYLLPDTGPGSTYRYVGAEAVRRDGWETLGDLGYVDEDGYLFLVDRRTDLIISGAANIYPAEVEGAIDRHPGVRSSAVIGLPHEDLGQVVHAIVDTAGQPLNVDELRGYLAGHLAPYKIPRSFELVDEPLRDDAGKLRRSALRAARVPEE